VKVLPSQALDPTVLEIAGHELVVTLADLIRIPSINPPPAGAPDGELIAARYVAGLLEDAGLRPELHEPVPGRGSVTARLRGDGSGGDPLLLLGHLDVVPAPPERWTHDPFGGEVVDGYVWGRGAVDMKDLVAMEASVVRMLAAEARADGRDPAADPIPGLTRDILFAATADEEAGGLAGAGWLAIDRPELLRAAGAINESGAVATDLFGVRTYPIGTAEKGYAVYAITIRGTWGHGSMPRADNAAVLAAEAIRRLAVPGRVQVVPVMTEFLQGLSGRVDDATARRIRDFVDSDDGSTHLEGCDDQIVLVARALLRDTVSPDVIHAGIKYNVIPGEARLEVDCRVLPGTTEDEIRAEILDRLGPELAAVSDVELVIFGEPVVSPTDTDLYHVLATTVRDHDPDGIPLPIMTPFASDAKHLAPLGIPVYGFSPLRFAAGERFLDRFHAVDERVSLDALRWGLPVLYDAVRRFCG
jgi:acetylornithine deacetylase/succinyl-diaminopimelate desuccinylase-like protein